MAVYIADMPDDQYVRIPNEVFRCGLSTRAIAVLGNICSHHRDFTATVELIAHQLEISKPTVIAAINDLESIGVVRRVKVEGVAGKFGRNDYAISMRKLSEWAKAKEKSKGDEPSKESLPGPSKESLPIEDQVKNTNLEDQPPIVPQGGQAAPSATESDEPALVDASEIQTAPKPKRKPEADYANDFDEWYAGYPLKVSKKAARRAYEKARKEGTTREELLEGLERSKRSWENSGTEKRYIPHPSTWLNKGKWDDEEFTYEDSLPRMPAGEDPLEIARRMAQREQQQAANYQQQFQPQPPQWEITQ